MAARRDRERRRPTAEPRYRFGTPEAPIEPEDTLLVENGETTAPLPDAGNTPPKRSRTAATESTPAPTRGGVRAAAKPFSAYRADYLYVLSDLRRVAIVIGSLLVILLVVYFALPH